MFRQKQQKQDNIKEVEYIEVQEKRTDIEESLRDFLLEAESKKTTIKCRLFKIRYNIGSTKKRFGWLQTYEGAIPEYEDIAQAFGPGEYQLNIWYNNGKDRKYTSRLIIIDEQFEGIHTSKLNNASQSGLNGYGNNPYLQLIMQNQQQMINTLLSSVVSRNNNGHSKYDNAIGDILLDNAKRTSNMMMEFTEKQIENKLNPNSTKTIPEKVEEWVELFFWLVDEFKENVGDSKIKLAFAKKQAQKDDRYQKLISDPELYKKVYLAVQEKMNVEDFNRIKEIFPEPKQ